MERKTKILTREEMDEKNRRQREWRSKNPEKMKEYKRRDFEKYPDRVRKTKNAWNAKPENRAKKKLYDRAYYERNKDWICLRNSLYAAEHSEYLKECQRLWAKNNPDKVLMSQKRCQEKHREKILARAKASTYRRRNAPGELLMQDIIDLQVMSDGVCAYCLKSLDDTDVEEHVDHAQPLSRGGYNEIENCVMSCADCNLQKNNKTPLEFVFDVKIKSRKKQNPKCQIAA